MTCKKGNFKNLAGSVARSLASAGVTIETRFEHATCASGGSGDDSFPTKARNVGRSAPVSKVKARAHAGISLPPSSHPPRDSIIFSRLDFSNLARALLKRAAPKTCALALRFRCAKANVCYMARARRCLYVCAASLLQNTVISRRAGAILYPRAALGTLLPCCWCRNSLSRLFISLSFLTLRALAFLPPSEQKTLKRIGKPGISRGFFHLPPFVAFCVPTHTRAQTQYVH